MSNTSSYVRRVALATTMGLLAAAATPALAGKPMRITVPASALRDASSKLCMPRSTSPIVGKDKSLPQTLCQTREAWAAHGVTIVTK